MIWSFSLTKAYLNVSYVLHGNKIPEVHISGGMGHLHILSQNCYLTAQWAKALYTNL